MLIFASPILFRHSLTPSTWYWYFSPSFSAFWEESLYYLYGKTLQEAKQTIEAQVRQEVERTISKTLKRRVDNLERVLTREDIVGLVEVDYLMPVDQEIVPPLELKLLRDRGFFICPRYGLKSYRPKADVTVLDLVNYTLQPEEREHILTQLKARLTDRSVMVIYK